MFDVRNLTMYFCQNCQTNGLVYRNVTNIEIEPGSSTLVCNKCDTVYVETRSNNNGKSGIGGELIRVGVLEPVQDQESAS